MQTLSESEFIARSVGSVHFSGEPELLLLREDLVEEWGSLIGYLECAAEVRERSLSDEFIKAAQDEWGHIIRLTRILANLDPVQAEAFKAEGLFGLIGFGHQAAVAPPPAAQPHPGNKAANRPRPEHRFPQKDMEPDSRTLECLRNAIRDELLAINVYQRQIQSSNNPFIQNTLVTIMNKKKEHVAVFTNILHYLIREYRLLAKPLFN